MGLFSDTISDARRPLDGWVRRTTADEPDAGASEDETVVDSAPPGIQTIYRFQKEGPAGSREASHQFGDGSIRQPAGDPLSAEGEAGKPVPTATNVGITDISVKGDSRGSNLETGHKERASPSKVTAASSVSASIPVQSEVSPAPFEAEFSRAVQESVAPEGREPSASKHGETFGSRITGRGAPSETHPLRLPLALQSLAASAADRGQMEVEMPLPAPSSGLSAGERRVGGVAAEQGSAARASDRPLATPSGLRIPGAPDRPRSGEARAASPREIAGQVPVGSGKAQPPAVAGDAEPRLVIGRIDVVVVSREAPKQATTAAAEQRAFLSRNYLKRL